MEMAVSEKHSPQRIFLINWNLLDLEIYNLSTIDSTSYNSKNVQKGCYYEVQRPLHIKKAWRSAGLHSHSFLTEICMNTRHLLFVLLEPANIVNRKLGRRSITGAGQSGASTSSDPFVCSALFHSSLFSPLIRSISTLWPLVQIIYAWDAQKPQKNRGNLSK